MLKSISPTNSTQKQTPLFELKRRKRQNNDFRQTKTTTKLHVIYIVPVKKPRTKQSHKGECLRRHNAITLPDASKNDLFNLRIAKAPTKLFESNPESGGSFLGPSQISQCNFWEEKTATRTLNIICIAFVQTQPSTSKPKEKSEEHLENKKDCCPHSTPPIPAPPRMPRAPNPGRRSGRSLPGALGECGSA